MKSKRVLLTLLMFFMFRMAWSQGFTIAGNELHDANGNNFVIKGINVPLAWFVNDVNNNIAAMKASTGSNCFRIVVTTATPDNAWQTCVQKCIDNKIIPMIELHDVTGNNSPAELNRMAQFWASKASYLTRPEIAKYILINIANEWSNWNMTANATGTVSRVTWRDAYITAVKTIRDAGIKTTLVCDAGGYGQDNKAQGILTYAKAIQASDVYHNCLFSVHMYCEWSVGGNSSVTSLLPSIKNAGIPIIVGEFGFQHSEGNGICDINENQIINTSNSNGIGWLAWSLKGNGGGVEYLDLSNNWTGTSLTAWGNTVVNGAGGTKTAVNASVFETVANAAPVITITSPAANTNFTVPGSIIISANATDADGTISTVQFYNGTTLLNTDITAPYTYVWSNVAAGTYSITAKATDNKGSSATSAPVSITVGPCAPTTVTPSVQINGGTWTAVTSVSVPAGGSVILGPQPITGGSWKWSGPNGFTAATREVAFTAIQTNQAGNYIATYTNPAGCLSTITFMVSVPLTDVRGLSNAASSPEANALYCYIQNLKGKKTLSGQMWSGWGFDELAYIQTNTGKQPAILGLDFIQESVNNKQVQLATDYWKKGGIPTIMWHWGAPGTGEGYEASKNEIDINRCFQAGTAEYTAFWAELKIKADHLEKLRDAGIPILWRPYHELNGNWFWWGKGGPAQFKKLWITMYNYFVNDRKLNNLIWVLCYTGSPDGSWYPGDQYVDIAGADTYVTNTGPQLNMYNAVKTIVNNTTPIAFHECGIMPDPAQCLSQNAMWSWWMEWHTGHLQGVDKTYLKNVYNHDLVITLDEVGSIMTACGSTACTPTPIVPHVQEDGVNWLQQATARACAGGTIMLGPQPDIAAGWTWTGPNNFAATTREITLANLTSAQAGIYTVSFKNAEGCSSTSQITVTVDALPVAPSVVSPVTYCQHATATPLAATGTLLKWYTTAAAGTALSAAPAPSTTTIGTTNYYVSQTTNGCESSRAQIAVTIHALPNIPSVVTPVAYCQKAPASLLTATGSLLKWYSSATTGTALTAAPTPSTTTIGTTNYYVSQTTNGCESSRAQIAVTVNALPIASITSNGTTGVCSGEVVTLTSGSGSSYIWRNGNAQVGTNRVYAATTAGDYTVEVTNASGCKATSVVTAVRVTAGTTWYADADGDGKGDVAVSKTACVKPAGYVSVAGDLCPADANKVNPGDCGCGNAETDSDQDGDADCMDTDDDNDGIADDTDCAPLDATINGGITWYADVDGDGKGDAAVIMTACTKPAGYVSVAGDLCPADVNKTEAGDCGCGNTEASCRDCAGVANGTALLDICNICSGGTTGITPITDLAACTTTGIVDLTANDAIKIVPNPSDSEFTLLLTNTSNIQVLSADGKLIEVFSDVNNLNFGGAYAKGVYILQISNGRTIQVLRVIKL